MKTIDRRHFIVLGSTAFAGLAVLPLSAETFPAPAQLFVGFAPRLARSRAIGRIGAAVFAADTVRTTQPSFARTGAQFSLLGVHRRDGGALRLFLDVMHNADGVEGQVPFHAWSYEASGQKVNSSSPLSFMVPVDSAKPLDLRFTISLGGAAVDQKVSFTVGRTEGAISLNPGSYIFAVADRAPDWSALRMDGEQLTAGFDNAPAPFDYLILSVSTPAA